MRRALRLSLAFALVAPAAAAAQEPLLVRGRVVAADGGAPVKGARVRAPQEEASVRTDANGRFTISIPLHSTLQIPRPGRAPEVVGALTVTKAGFITALADVNSNAREIVVRLTRGAAITVHVFDTLNEPLRTSVRISGGGRSVSASSDDRGQFRFPNLRADTYTVSVGGGAGVSVRLPPRELSDDEVIRLRREIERRSQKMASDAAQSPSSTFVRLAAGEEAVVYMVDLTPRSVNPSIDLSGVPRKGTASVQGRVLLADGRPVAGATVSATPGVAPSSGRAVTDGTGAFRIGGLPAGEFRVWVNKTGLVSTEPATDAVPPGLNVSLAAGEERRDVVLRLAEAGEVVGTVLDEYGDPVERAVVVLVRVADSVDAAPITQPRAGTASSDDRGRYRVPLVPPGAYQVVTLGEPRAQGETYLYSPGTVSSRDARTVTVQPGEQVTGIDFRLNPALGLQISGTVIDSSGRERADGVVQLRGTEASGATVRFVRSASLDSYGRFTFLNVAPGRYALSVQIGQTSQPRLPQVVNGEVVRTPPPSAGGREAGSVRVEVSTESREPVIIRTEPSRPPDGNPTSPEAVTSPPR
jgi:protocatechuate 3,4-dioxygenase beta subunit